MPTNWQKKAAKAKRDTDAVFSEQMQQLSGLSAPDLAAILKDNTMNQAEFNQVLQIVKDQTKQNNDKIKAIQNIENGVGVLIGLVGKLL